MRNKKLWYILAICKNLKILWHFENPGKILKCGIHVSWKWLIVERNGRKFGTWCTTVYIDRVGVVKRLLLTQLSFNFNQTFMKSMVIRRNTGYSLFWRSAKNSKFYATLKFLLTQDHMGLGISKRYSSYSFHPMSLKPYEDIGYHGRIQPVTFLDKRPNLNENVALWNLTWESMGKSWNVQYLEDGWL